MSNHVFLYQIGHFCVELGFFVSNECYNYSSMLGLNLIHVSKRGHRSHFSGNCTTTTVFLSASATASHYGECPRSLLLPCKWRPTPSPLLIPYIKRSDALYCQARALCVTRTFTSVLRELVAWFAVTPAGRHIAGRQAMGTVRIRGTLVTHSCKYNQSICLIHRHL